MDSSVISRLPPSGNMVRLCRGQAFCFCFSLRLMFGGLRQPRLGEAPLRGRGLRDSAYEWSGIKFRLRFLELET